MISMLYIKTIHGLGVAFSLPIVPLNKITYKNAMLLVSFKRIRNYIIFAILFVSLKNISIVCYNMKVQISVTIILIIIKVISIKIS